ncbi:hypothetical protein QU912_25940, partial [Escherichia coli]|nr:hypothetical protein [Escherichia coli]
MDVVRKGYALFQLGKFEDLRKQQVQFQDAAEELNELDSVIFRSFGLNLNARCVFLKELQTYVTDKSTLLKFYSELVDSGSCLNNLVNEENNIELPCA